MTAEAVVSTDIVRPFSVEGLDIRGRFVRLGPTVHGIVSKHAYPEAVSRLLGEALVLAAQIGSSLKFEGKISIQLRGSGPVTMVVADFFTPGELRAYASVMDGAKFDADAVTDHGLARLEPLLGEGTFALVIDQGPDTERYQAVVSLEGETLADAAKAYFRQSEQLPTSFELAMAQLYVPGVIETVPGGQWTAAGLMLQHVPTSSRTSGTGEPAGEAWNRSLHLLHTVEAHELLDPQLSSERLLLRLFHEDGVRVFPEIPLKEGCTCRAAGVEAVLKTYAPDDLADMVIDGRIEVQCEFCRTTYLFDPQTLDLVSEERPGTE